MPVSSVRCAGQPPSPLGEVGEHQDALAGLEDRLHDLLEAGQLAGPSGQRAVVGLVGRGVVADLLERRDGGQDGALAALPAHLRGLGHQPVEHRLVEADLLGRHRAVVELVDAVGQLGRDDRARSWCGGTRGCR